MAPQSLRDCLRTAHLVFWDFDGVIKDSVDVKTRAYVDLFASFGSDVAEKVRAHHLANGGMSRFAKLPMYLEWAGEKPSRERIEEFCDRFSKLVWQGVIDAPWVPGAEKYLRENPYRQSFVVVSATPQEELEQILLAIDLRQWIDDVYGAPVEKSDAIRIAMQAHNMRPEQCLMVGDASADLLAAQENDVPFLLRRHATNEDVFVDYTGNATIDFENS